MIALQEQRTEDAEKLIAQAVAMAPGNAKAESDLGAVRAMLGRYGEAIQSFRRTLALDPTLGSTHYNLGNSLAALGRDDEAIESYRRALELLPNSAGAHNNLGNIWQKKGLLPEAAACFRRAVELQPGLMQAHSNLGDVLTKLGHLQEAIASCERAVALQPDFPGARQNLAVAWMRQGDYARAAACFRRAIEDQADFSPSRLGLAILLLLEGRYREGWREYEWRLMSPTNAVRLRALPEPRWQGTPMPGGTLFIHAEQGFGDTLQFMRYVPLACQRAGAARVIVECQRELAGLLSATGGWGGDVIARPGPDGPALPRYDVQVPMLSLPLTLEQFEPMPMPAPYVRAQEHLRAVWRGRLAAAPGLRAGLVWAGNPAHPEDRLRTIPPAQLLPLLQVPGVVFYSLQMEPRDGVSSPALHEAGIRDLTAHIGDFADTAALVAELDLVITVDTATAHLAGALGSPVWTLLPFVPDWRWGLEKEDTPWYPTMRLFRQRAIGDWNPVIAAVREQLLRLVESRGRTRDHPAGPAA